MPSQAIKVFVSYSHADASLVAPVVRLLRVNKSLVFQDADRIPPGKRWREEIAKALAESKLVVVFWCDHASRSNEVSTEWRAAIEQDKDLLPLLLDATPCPQSWAPFSGLTFEEQSARTTARSTHPLTTFSQARHCHGQWRHRHGVRFGTPSLASRRLRPSSQTPYLCWHSDPWPPAVSASTGSVQCRAHHLDPASAGSCWRARRMRFVVTAPAHET